MQSLSPTEIDPGDLIQGQNKRDSYTSGTWKEADRGRLHLTQRRGKIFMNGASSLFPAHNIPTC
jgi:hypothetical protein